MLTLDNTGINMFVLASMKEHWLYLLLFFCLCCVVPLSMHSRLWLVTVHMKVLLIGRNVTFSKRTDCWFTLSCGICKQNGHFLSCI